MLSDTTTGPAKESWWRLIRNLLILLAVIGALAFAAFPLAGLLGLLATAQGRVGAFLVGSICGELAALYVLARLLRPHGMALRDLGLGRPTTAPAVLLGLLVALAYSAVTALNPAVRAHLFHLSILKAIALLAALVAGVVEETIFRGYVMTALQRMGHGRAVQLLVSGIAFALAHVYGFTSLLAYLTTQA